MKYLISYGINSGTRALNNPTLSVSAKDKQDAIDLFKHLKGNRHTIQLIKEVNY